MAQAIYKTRDMPELLQWGLEIYEALKNDMRQALGLRHYAEKLTEVTEILRAVHKYLNEEERAIGETLEKAHILSREGMRKAIVVVSVIKEHCEALTLVLSESVPGKKHEKMALACSYFSGFAEHTASSVKEVMIELQRATDELERAQSKLTLIVKAVQRVHRQLSDQKAAVARMRAAAYGAAAVGALFGPIGLLITYGVAAGITEGYAMQMFENVFDFKQKNVEEYIDGFKKMHEETKDIADKVKAKCDQLTSIHSKLATTEKLADAKSTFELYFADVRKRVDDLFKACDEFLQGCKSNTSGPCTSSSVA